MGFEYTTTDGQRGILSGLRQSNKKPVKSQSDRMYENYFRHLQFEDDLCNPLKEWGGKGRR